MIKQIQDRGGLSGGRSPEGSFPLPRPLCIHTAHPTHSCTPSPPSTLHTHTHRRDEKGHRFPHDAPSSGRASVSQKAQALPQSPRLLDSYFGPGRVSCREDSEQDAKEALVAEGVLCGRHRRHQRVVFGVRLAEGQELGRRLRHLRAPARSPSSPEAPPLPTTPPAEPRPRVHPSWERNLPAGPTPSSAGCGPPPRSPRRPPHRVPAPSCGRGSPPASAVPPSCGPPRSWPCCWTWLRVGRA